MSWDTSYDYGFSYPNSWEMEPKFLSDEYQYAASIFNPEKVEILEEKSEFSPTISDEKEPASPRSTSSEELIIRVPPSKKRARTNSIDETDSDVQATAEPIFKKPPSRPEKKTKTKHILTTQTKIQTPVTIPPPPKERVFTLNNFVEVLEIMMINYKKEGTTNQTEFVKSFQQLMEFCLSCKTLPESVIPAIKIKINALLSRPNVNSKNIETWKLIVEGLLLHFQGKKTEAIESYKNAFQNQSNIFSLLFSGCAYLTQDEYKKAGSCCAHAIKFEPTCVVPYLLLGNAFRLLNEFDKALETLTKALEMSPNNAFALTRRGLVHLLKGNLVEAENDLLEAVKLEPNNVIALGGLSEAQLKFGLFNYAWENLLKASRIDPTNLYIIKCKADFFVEKGDCTEALKEYTKALSIDANDIFSLIARARIYIFQKKPDLAKADIAKVLELEPENPTALLLQSELSKEILA